MIKSKYIHILFKHTKIYYVVELTGEECPSSSGEIFEYIKVLDTNDSSYYESIAKSSLDMELFNKEKYPHIVAKYITYEQAMAYAI